MTVQNTTVKDIYVGNGATTKFPITFQMTDHPEYIKVYITGDDSVAVETENFSVDLGAKTVTYPANGDPLPDGHKITIYRELPLYQLMNLVNQGPFFAENIELSFDDLTFICQQLNEKLDRTLSAGIDVSNFNNTFPVKAGMSFRINDAGDGLVLTEDPARVLPLAKDVLEQTKQVKESAVNETTNIKNTAIEELTAIKDAAVNETTKIKDEAVAAKNTAVGAAATAAEDAVNNVQTLLDEKVAAAENAKSVAVSSAESALASKNAAAASQSSATASAETATEQADRAQDIADSLEGLAGITGIATTEEAIAGESDTKAMTPLKTKEAIKAQVPIQTIIDSIYIVGQIVEYASNVNPNDLYPWQTWEQIKDVFTLASGDKYSIGQTGGVSTVTLTVAQIPEHIHIASVQNASLTGRINGSANSSNGYNNNPLSGSGVFSGSGAIYGYGEGGEWNSGTATWAGLNFGGTHNHGISIGTTGGGEAHNNMPPYLVTIKWKRTA